MLFGGCFNVEIEREEGVWPPWNCPVSCESSGASKSVVHEGVVNNVARRNAMVRGKDLEVELGGKHCAGDASRLVLPEGIGVVRRLDEGQESCQYGGIGLTLEIFSSLHVDSCHENGAFSGLPKKGLVSTSLDGESFQWRQTARRVTKHKKSSMRARVVLIGQSWRSKRCPASCGEVLTGLLVLLWIEMCLSKDVHLTLS